jgi:hypothetical protein
VLQALAYEARGQITPNPYRIHFVPPEEVKYVQTGSLTDPVFTASQYGRFNPYDAGRLVAGDWDHQVERVEDTVVYQGLFQRFIERRDWKDTLLHPSHLPETHPNIGRRYRGLTPDEFLRVVSFIDELYASLARIGCVCHKELGRCFWDELAVNITRTGELIRNSSGQHRLILARLLQLKYIPVRVLVVHADWVPCPGVVFPARFRDPSCS